MLQCTQTAYSDKYSNTMRLVTVLPLPHNGHLQPTSDIQTDIKDFSYLSILQKDPLSEFFLKKEPRYRLGDCRVHILRRDFSVLRLRIFKTLQLFVPNSKRLRGYTQWVPFFSEKVHVTQRSFQEGPLQGFSSKEPGSSLFTWRDLKK
jgi:hypothetical protein